MMRLVLVLLAGLCVWLLVERHRLSTGLADLESKADRLQKEKVDLEKRIARATTPVATKKTWLQERIEQSSNALSGSERGESIR